MPVTMSEFGCTPQHDASPGFLATKNCWAENTIRKKSERVEVYRGVVYHCVG